MQILLLHLGKRATPPPLPGLRTCFHRAVDVSFGLIIDPVEAGLHRQPGQGAVFALVPVRGGDVHGPALVVQRLLEVVSVLVPALGDPQLHPRPLIHHRDGQRVQLVFTSLCGGEKWGHLVTWCVFWHRKMWKISIFHQDS